jgi:DNA-binding XRE family transcriptional regulator
MLENLAFTFIMTSKRWDEPQYQQMASATLEGNYLVVLFEDGVSAKVPTEGLLPPGTSHPLWDKMQVNLYEITIPTSVGEREIPWTTIRLLTDSKFATYMAQVAEEQAQDVGHRLRELRQSKGLTGKEVAERAGITAQSLSRIENGHHDVVFTTLKKILTAMGATLADLAEVDETPILTP